MQRTIALLLLIGALLAAVPGSAQTELRDAANELSKKLHDDKDVQKLKGERILIAAFDNVTGKGDVVPRTLQEMLTTAFIKAKTLKVVERAQMEKALKELKLSLSDLVDPDNRKKLGKMVGAAYILVGSISEGSTTVAIDARIIQIETGESVAAEDASVRAGGGPPGGMPQPAGTTYAAPGAPPDPVAAKPDLNAKGMREGAGEWTGKKPDMGVLGGASLRIAWREKLPVDEVVSFAAGDTLGDGSLRLATSSADLLAIWRWDGRLFRRTYDTAEWGGSRWLHFVPAKTGAGHLLTRGGECLTWTGTSYAKSSLRTASGFGFYCLDCPADCGGKVVGGTGISSVAAVFAHSPTSSHSQLSFEPVPGMALPYPMLIGDLQATASDLDGDGSIEFVYLKQAHERDDAGPIVVLGRDGQRRASTVAEYGAHLTTWNPWRQKCAVLVTSVNADDAGSGGLGHVCFVQFTGESYEEVWRSIPMTGRIEDIKICDPKGEGTAALIVLTRDKSGCYLTRIEPEK